MILYTLDSFYRSDEYKKFRKVVIAERTRPDKYVYCEYCGKPIVKAYDLITHHKKELTETNVNDALISLNPELIMLLHFKCHNIIHRRFGEEAKKQVYIVYGAPFSGKTSWVMENASPNDLIVDMDSIFQMISINDRYVKNERLKSAAFEVRDKLLEIIKYRSGKWQDAYVIGGYPLLMDRKRLEQRLNAVSIFIDTPKEKCIERLYEDDARDLVEWSKYIYEWFDRYQPDD